MIYYTNSAEQTMEVGYNLAKKINDANPQSTKMVYIALKGEMGVGKTAFTIGFSSFYGITGVKSPTYTVMNEYRSERGKRLYHFDMYRISGEDDLYSIGYDDYLDTDAVIIVEWSENILQFIPEDAIFVTIERCSDSEAKRKITIQSPDFD